MSNKRVFQIIVGIAVVVAAFLIVQPFSRASAVAGQSQRALRLYQLSERYGVAAEPVVSPELVHQYQMSERYGQAAAPVITPELMHLYQMSERYGQAAAPVITPELMHLYQMGERYGAP